METGSTRRRWLRATKMAAFALAFGCGFASGALAQSAHDQPWRSDNVLLVLDPYEANSIDWAAVASDRKVKAVLHRASIGMRTDKAYLARAAEARRWGLLWGAYHLGTTGDPKAQADLLIDLARRTNTSFLALDIEALGGSNMSLEHAEVFVQRIYDKTGRYPALYVNWSVYEEISRRYGRNSVFAKTPLWIARFINRLPALNGRVWSDYALWQFASELNCPEAVRALRKPSLCESYRPYVVPGVKFDMDVNAFNGDAAALARLFGSPPP